MPSNTASRRCHGTLTGTSIETVTLTGQVSKARIVLRSGSAECWATVGYANQSPAQADPVAEADETYFVGFGAGDFVDIYHIRPGAGDLTVKILGNGHKYTVEAR
ncbi:MAG: hypothetical protein E6R03_12750 [Hyphomicrobiaceae bacterium]|nr:MAG: hypothetical protein E6R03_12750 [Hyphomicrobiaceae bacterium]